MNRRTRLRYLHISQIFYLKSQPWRSYKREEKTLFGGEYLQNKAIFSHLKLLGQTSIISMKYIHTPFYTFIKLKYISLAKPSIVRCLKTDSIWFSTTFSKFESSFEQLGARIETKASTNRWRYLLGFPRLYRETWDKSIYHNTLS